MLTDLAPYFAVMLDKIADLAANCRACVVLTGAGISAESGVPTFRGQEGLWAKFRPEELANMNAFLANPKLVWEWYCWRRTLMAAVKPNPGHEAITRLEKLFDSFVLITQNVDGLHGAAGTVRVLELHGDIHRNKCVACGRPHLAMRDIDPDNIPVCTTCGGKIRPDVVWFGEMLDEEILAEAFRVSEEADIFLCVGTSAVVHPAASLPVVAKRHGATLVEINVEQTPLTELADYHLPGKAGEILPELARRLEAKGRERQATRRIMDV